jgi:hypothetical protein
MTKWFTSLIRQIVGRLKKNMAEWFMAAGCLFMASGIAMGISQIGKLTWQTMILTTFILLIGALFGNHSFNLVKYREKKDNAKDNLDINLMLGILNELKGLRQDIKGDKNGTNSSSKPM